VTPRTTRPCNGHRYHSEYSLDGSLAWHDRLLPLQLSLNFSETKPWQGLPYYAVAVTMAQLKIAAAQ
jgi:hypothetical protein